MQRGLEYVNVSGLRLDGRRAHESRRLSCRLGALPDADGSALVALGNTRVLAAVHGPREATRRSESEHDQAFLSCEFAVAPFAGSERRKRRAGDRRLAESAAALRASLESVVIARLYPRSEVAVYVLVLQADGGQLAAAVNAACLALIDAGVALRDFVVASAVTHISRVTLLDPNATECAAGGPELIVAQLPRSGKLTLASMDARLAMDQLEPCLALAAEGCRQALEVMRSAVREATAAKVAGNIGGVAGDGIGTARDGFGTAGKGANADDEQFGAIGEEFAEGEGEDGGDDGDGDGHGAR
jgi:exosome complex component RRP41